MFDAKHEGNALSEASITQQIDVELQTIDLKFQSAIDTLVESYDEHMKKILPKPKMLPIRVSIVIEEK